MSGPALFDLAAYPPALNALLFAAAAGGVWSAGTRLASYADEISDRKKLGQALMGLIFLAGATELPEVVTTMTAAIAGEARLLLNNMFGGVTMQTAILAVADGFAGTAAITFYPRKPTPILEAALLILMLTLLNVIILFGETPLLFHVGIGACAVALAYLVAIAILRRYDEKDVWLAIEVPEETGDKPVYPWRVRLESLPMTGLAARFAGASVLILICGVVLVHAADALADQTGLGASFVGATLLAATTSLPEVSTTIMAVRLRAYTMAISNIFGSNLI
ncbi:MAG TPA: sodium:calcium antiporter, partial [Afifellaceae bacterium]|nr:sodium:calcium antiporter [Afifellaceae bacterium]